MDEDNGWVRVSVTDHGDGIAESYLPKLFSKFTRGDAMELGQKEGTGLGLSLTKSMVELLGGRIGYQTKKGVGTTFFFDLPEYQGKISARKSPNRKLRALILEPDLEVAKHLGSLAQTLGFEFDSATTVLQANALMNFHVYDVITIDAVLPDADSAAFARNLKEKNATQNIPLIVVTMKKRTASDEWANASNVVDWIEKPLSEARFLAALRRAVLTLDTSVMPIKGPLDIGNTGLHSKN
jgi:CheY-like chemotaxis protein